jgi:hypothetical protein
MGAVTRITGTSPSSCNSSDAFAADSGPNNLLTALTNELNSLPCASCRLTPNWKKILSRSVAIKAEVRSRVYWTNVLIDPKVSVDIVFPGCTGQISLQQVHEARRLFADRNREL